MNRASACGESLGDDASIEALGAAAAKLQARFGESCAACGRVELDDPSELARIGTAIATIHAALHRIRHEALKRLDGADLSEDEAAEQMLAWLRQRGRLPSTEH